MNIGIIDAELSYASKHRFPNLACMKIGRFHKQNGDAVRLIEAPDASLMSEFDKIYISKVFTNTVVPEEILTSPNVETGGTGFLFDKAPPLPDAVEHSFPDYHLYDAWLAKQKKAAWKNKYTDFSIGYTTRGCFRKCDFCVNKSYDRVIRWSHVNEFVDKSRPYIGLCDDNVFGCGEWRDIFEELQSTGKPFSYNQGLDIRLLTEDKAEVLSNSKYYGHITFAFDNIKDKDLIISKMKILNKYSFGNTPRFFVLSGFDYNGKWEDDFWDDDIHGVLERSRLLMENGCLPYVTRFEKQYSSPRIGMYNVIASWANQPINISTMSIREFCEHQCERRSTKYKTYIEEYEHDNPWVTEYLDMKWKGGKVADGEID